MYLSMKVVINNNTDVFDLVIPGEKNMKKICLIVPFSFFFFEISMACF
jgi:hypothetical protein